MKTGRIITALALLLSSGCAVDEAQPVEEDLNDAWLELQNPDGSADSARCSGVTVPDRGPFDHRIALTFDDGPNLQTTPRVLDILAAHGATATFFINGRTVSSEAHMELLRRMQAEGHIVGNHTETHPNSVTISSSAFRNEVTSVTEILDEIGVAENRRFFRFPFGSSNCSTHEIVDSLGYNVTGWHIDSADWCFANSREGVGYCSPSTFQYVDSAYRRDFVGFALSQARATGGGVLLMHDIHSFTTNNLDALLTRLEQEGFTFVGADDVATFPLLNGQEPPPEPWIGTPCTQDVDCAFSYGDDRPGYCALYDTLVEGVPTTAGYCSMVCEGTCPDRYGHATTFCVATDEEGVGGCASKSEEANGYCAELPGTAAVSAERFIGSSGVSPSTATVCLPAE